MENVVDSYIAERALNHFGIDNQASKCIEELNELAVELVHYRQHRSTLNSLVSEIADVYITLEQQKIAYGITSEMVQRQIDYKEQRLLNRIELGKESSE